jgi:hypothetical protein
MKLDNKRQQKLEFNIEVEGADQNELSPRLVLKDGDLSFLIEGKVENSKFIFLTPPLEKRSTSAVLEARVEVVVREKLLSVWEGRFEIDRTPVVRVSEAIVGGESEKGMTVKVSPVTVVAATSSPPPVPVAKAKVEKAPAPPEKKMPVVERPVPLRPKAKPYLVDHSDPIEKIIDQMA